MASRIATGIDPQFMVAEVARLSTVWRWKIPNSAVESLP
jgi:hypothetical protein